MLNFDFMSSVITQDLQEIITYVFFHQGLVPLSSKPLYYVVPTWRVAMMRVGRAAEEGEDTEKAMVQD